MHISLAALVVPDYDAAISFYCDRVGFDLVEDIDQGHKRWVVVRPKGAETGLLLAKAAGEAQAAAIGQQTGGRVSFFLRVEDFARTHAAMISAGVTFEEDPRYEAYGTVAVWRDPFGNRWDLLGPPERG